MRNKALRALVESAVLIAVAMVLSLIELDIMPSGGSVGIVMVPLVIIGVRWGVFVGTGAGFVFGFLKAVLIGEGLSYGLGSVILDYVIAYGAVSFSAGLFSKRKYGALYGLALGTFLRFIAHFISGVTLFRLTEATEIFGIKFNSDAFILYSIVYNAPFLLVNFAICFVILFFLMIGLKTQLKRQNL